MYIYVVVFKRQRCIFWKQQAYLGYVSKKMLIHLAVSLLLFDLEGRDVY
jgi:hypothetical protein